MLRVESGEEDGTSNERTIHARRIYTKSYRVRTPPRRLRVPKIQARSFSWFCRNMKRISYFTFGTQSAWIFGHHLHFTKATLSLRLFYHHAWWLVDGFSISLGSHLRSRSIGDQESPRKKICPKLSTRFGLAQRFSNTVRQSKKILVFVRIRAQALIKGCVVPTINK